MATALHLVEPAPNDFLAGLGKSSNRAAIQYASELTRTAYGAQTRTAYGAPTRDALDEHYNDEQ